MGRFKFGKECKNFGIRYFPEDIQCKRCKREHEKDFKLCQKKIKKRRQKSSNVTELKIKRRRKKKQKIDNTESYENCKGPLSEYCEGCEKVIECLDNELYWYSRIAHWILDKYLPKLSLCATKIFIFLNRSANFDEDNKHFGRCWFKYSQIEEATGVKASNMRKYIEELVRHKLIKHKLQRFFENDCYKTSHEFTVTWYKRMKELRKDVNEVWRKEIGKPQFKKGAK